MSYWHQWGNVLTLLAAGDGKGNLSTKRFCSSTNNSVYPQYVVFIISTCTSATEVTFCCADNSSIQTTDDGGNLLATARRFSVQHHILLGNQLHIRNSNNLEQTFTNHWQNTSFSPATSGYQGSLTSLTAAWMDHKKFISQ